MPARSGSERPQLGAALAGDHEQRARAGDDEEPRRDGDSHRDAARDRARATKPHATAPRSSTGSCLSQTLYAMVERDVAADHERQLPAGRERQRDRGGAEHDPAGHRRVHAHLARRDRSVLLGRVAPVGLDVDRVVDEVGRARGQAEADECDAGAERRLRVRDHARRAGRGDDEHVLEPLLRAGQAHERPCVLLGLDEPPVARPFGLHAGCILRRGPRGRSELERLVLEVGDEPLHGSHGHPRAQPHEQAAEHPGRGEQRAQPEAQLAAQEEVVGEERARHATGDARDPRPRRRRVAAERDQRLGQREGEDEAAAAEREQADVAVARA